MNFHCIGLDMREYGFKMLSVGSPGRIFHSEKFRNNSEKFKSEYISIQGAIPVIPYISPLGFLTRQDRDARMLPFCMQSACDVLEVPLHTREQDISSGEGHMQLHTTCT